MITGMHARDTERQDTPSGPDRTRAQLRVADRVVQTHVDQLAAQLLTEHQRVGAGDCTCGTQLPLGTSYASHQRVVLRAAGVLRG